MKSAETREQFIALRGAGKSIRSACKEVGISTSTGQEWETELKERVEEARKERLTELHELYGMTKEKRIERIGSTLNKLTNAIQEIDIATLPPDKLLDYQLKYMDALKGEYTPPRAKIEAGTPKEALVKVLLDTAEGVRSGELTAEQAKNETQAVANLLKAVEQFKPEATQDASIKIRFVTSEYKPAYTDEKTGIQYFTRTDTERDSAGLKPEQKQYINGT